MIEHPNYTDRLTTAATTTTHGASSTPSAATTTSATASASTTATATATSTAAARIRKPTHGQQLVRGNVEHIVLLEALGDNARIGLDRKHDVLDGPKDLVDLANLLLVLQVDAGVEVRDLGIAVR